MSGNIFFHEKKSERHIYQRKKHNRKQCFWTISDILSALCKATTHSPYKTKDAVSNPQIRHLHYSNHARNSYVLLVYTTEKKHFISLSPLVRACVLVIG